MNDLTQEIRVSTDHMTYTYRPLVYKVFLGLLISYKLIFQLTAMVLALCTHDIKVKGLDDAKYIIATVYITTINLLLLAMIAFTLAENLYTYTSSLLILVFIATTIILGVVFIPKASTLEIPYSGKIWRALNFANRSSEHIGEF